MWLLKDDNNERLIYLKPNAMMIVGRNRGDIILSDDGSISRVHAHVTVKTILNSDQITDKAQPLSKCIIKDPGSKYGNFVLKDGQAIRITEEGYVLRHMDRIRFGLQNYIFTVHYIPIITATSGMSDDEKKELKKLIEAIDGKVTPVWNTLCTHMTIVKPTISEKLSCALAAQTLIVPMDYWDSVTEAFTNNTELPDPADFVVSINIRMQEIGKVSVSPIPARKTLFHNLTFLHFSSKQFHLYARMIKLAGGKSILYSQRRVIPDVCDDSVIVVQLVESNTTQATGTGDASYAAVCEKLSRCRRRTIPESEIAIAILHCTTDKYCNPTYDYAVLFERRAAENQSRDMTVLAVDTQDVLPPSTSRHGQNNNPSRSAVCIPESVAESYDTQPDTANEHPKGSSTDLPTTTESCSDRSAAEMPSDSVADDLPSESQIGSMKLASLNHEHYVEEEFKKRALNKDISNKRGREEEEYGAHEREKKVCLGVSSIGERSTKESSEPCNWVTSDDEIVSDSEDDRSVERKKEVGFSISSIDKGSKKESSGPSKWAQSGKEIVPDSENDRSCERQKEIAPGASSFSETRGQEQSEPSKSDLSYEEMMPDDEDAFFMDEKVSIVDEVLEKEQERQRSKSIASRLSPAEQANDVGIPGRPGKSVEIVKHEDAGAKSTSAASSASRIGKDSFRTGERKISEDTVADENENTRKRKIGRCDTPPFSDTVENSYKCSKPEVTHEQQSDRPWSKNSSVKRPLMDVTSPSPRHRKKYADKEESFWITSNTTDPLGSEKTARTFDDTSRTSHDYETTEFVKLSNDPNAPMIPLLRIKCPADIYTKDGPRFGKRFRKQQITIPPRVELDGSVYESSYRQIEPKKRVSLDGDEEYAATSHKVTPTNRTGAKKSFFRL